MGGCGSHTSRVVPPSPEDHTSMFVVPHALVRVGLVSKSPPLSES